MATSGAVLEGAKASQTNSAHADLPTCGVARDFKSPSSQPFAAISPAVVDLHGSQYAASFLDDAQPDQTQYAVWAANSSQVALVPITTTDANTKGVVLGTGDIPQGNLTVGSHTDGADFLAVQDTAGRAVGKVLAVVLRQGSSAYFLLVGTGCTAPTVVIKDSNGDPVVLTTISDAFSTVDPDAGYVGLSTAVLTALGGGVSQAGGDAVYSSYLVLDNQKFWWSKNDAQTARFTYDAKTQKWLPIKGQSVQDVGVITSNGTYTLSPPVRNFDVGDYLPASATDSDKYAMLRAGIIPSAAASTPLAYVASPTPGQFSGIRVVNDSDVAGFQFTGADADLSGVVGLSKGSLHLNPAFSTANLGLHLWYSAYTFNTASVGVVGALKGADSVPLFIAPIPAPNEMPFLKVGSRRYLTAITVANDAALLAHAAPADSQVIVSLSTGRLRFSTNLPKYADSIDALFNPSYLGAQVLYDGVACCGKAQPLRQPSVLVDGAGAPISDVSVADTLYLAPADPFGANGLGTSGIFYLPDNTGSLPQTGTPPVRAGGDNLADDNIGLVRRIGSRNEGYALGDDVFYWYDKAFAATRAVGYESGIPWATSWNINEDTALVTEQAITSDLSRVQPNSDVQESISGPIYYLNALFTPASYTDKASLTSRIRNIFAVRESRTEKLWFTVDADSFLWSATLLPLVGASFTTEQMAASLLLSPKIGGGGTLGSLHPNAVSTDRGYLTLTGTSSVSIGFGTPDLDLSGCRATGFLAGWQATAGQDNWYNDSGLSFGMARSPLNLSRTSPDPDYIDRVRTIDRVLTSDLKSYPYLGVDYAPLRDIVGYGVDTFFRRIATVKDQPITQDLLQYEDILYDFAYNRFAWLEAGSIEALVIQPASELSLGNTGLVPDTMLGVDPNPTGGLSVATGNGAYQNLKQGTDYLLPDNGQRGSALLIEEIGGQVANGYRGVWASGASSFSDSQADFVAAGVAAGYLLRVYPAGSPTQTYTVSAVTGASSLLVLPAFNTDSTGGNWQVFKGETDAVYDRAVVADMVYENFDPLPDQTFIVHLLSPLGTTPVDAAAQTASRLKANVDDATANARTINLRFGKEGTGTAALTLLGQQELGSLANGLFVQGVGTLRYTTQSFSLLVGDKLFSHSSLVTPLTPVAVFSSNPVGAEYLTTTGELKFNATLLSSYSGSLVYQADEFLPAASLTAGQAEFKQSGDLNLSDADITAHQQVTVFFEEALNAGTDMTVSPMAGAFFLDKPLRAYQLVKCHYWQASPSGEIAVDVSGNPIEITEFLPFYVSMEKAVRVDSTHYTFDPADNNGFTHTVRQDITPTAYVGSVLQNYGQTTTATFDYKTRTVTLLAEVADTTTTVKVSYAVDEAFGGERTFNVSTLPVFQPPFFLPADVSTFKLAGQANLTAGQLLRLGASTFYVQKVSYDVHEVAVPSLDAPYLSYPNTKGITTVDFFPPTIAEAGSRSPSQQALTLITARPVTDSVNGTTTSAPTGLFLTISTLYEPVSRGQTSITFKGPVEFSTNAPSVSVTAGMILEIGGHPYTVADSQLSEDGTQQRVSVTAPFIYFYEPANGDTVRLSVRPVYPQGAKQFLPIGPVVATQDVELVYFAEGKAGVLLQSDLDYKVNINTGAFQLISQTSKGLQAGDRYLARYTAQRVLSVQFANGIPQIPRYSANYRFTTLPSMDNGLLGSTVQARYTFAYPDSFYCRDLPLLAYLGEFAKTIASLTQQLTSQSSGPVFSSSSISLADHGQPSLLSQRMTLTNQDRAARQYLSFYNDLIVGFEQVLETINGQIVGDRDGKFRFYNEDAGLVPTPGMTEPITGTLTPRNIYSSVWNAYAASYIPLLQTDYLVDPYQSYSLVDGVLDGSRTDASLLSQLIAGQSRHIRNDIDDILLTRSNGIHFKLLFSLYSTGHYANMAEPNPFSRLFPEQTRGMMITAPGLDADLANGYGGKYAFMDFSKLWEEGIRSTFLKQIAQVSNPALGDITNLSSISTELRTPRAWVWGFFPDGIPADALYTGQTAVTDPCVIGTVLPLGQIPVNPVTGYPDMTLFASQAGPTGLPDLTTGDPNILLPYWQSAQFGRFWDVMQLEAGTPDGRSVAITGPSLTADDTPGGLYVREVLHGCVLTFSDYTNTPITSASQLINLAGGLWAPVQGDTLLVRVRPDSSNTSLYQTLRFKDNSDVIARFASGGIDDFTVIHSTGNSPAPLQFWQSEVGFTNNSLAPLSFPALQGQDTLDNGDYSFPFLRASNTELVRFGQITDAMADVMTAHSPAPNYIYPDEVLFDGTLQTSFGPAQPPATLLSSENFSPLGVGKGPVTTYDLLLVQTSTGNPSLPSSAEGFHSVAALATLSGETQVEVPRFPSETAKGAEIKYLLQNAMAERTLTGSVRIIEDRTGVPPFVPSVNSSPFKIVTMLDFGLVNPLFLDDGKNAGAGVPSQGGLNRILNASPNNRIRIRLYNTQDTTEGGVPYDKGDYVEEFILYKNAFGGEYTITANVAGTSVSGAVQFGWNQNHKVMRFVPGAGVVSPAGALVDLPSAGVTRFGTITGAGGVWTTNSYFNFSVDVIVSAGVSVTGWLKPDRLTFAECLDLTQAKHRGYMEPDGGRDLQTTLIIESVGAKDSSTADQWLDYSTLNGRTDSSGCPFTFLPRTSSGDVGTFTTASASGAGDEEGTVKVMSWEGYKPVGCGATADANLTADRVTSVSMVTGGSGYVGGYVQVILSDPPTGRTATAVATVASGVVTGITIKLKGSGYVAPPTVTILHFAGNQPIEDTTGILTSALASSAQDETGVICAASALFYDGLYPNPILTNVVPTAGAVSQVVAGDVVEVKYATDNPTYKATKLAGSYLVRQAVAPTAPSTAYKKLDVTTVAGLGAGWFPISFPTVVSSSLGALTVKLNTLNKFGGIEILDASLAVQTVLTTAVPHGYLVGDSIAIAGASTVASINGTHTVLAVPSANTLQIGVSVGAFLSGGRILDAAAPSPPHLWVGDKDYGAFPDPDRFHTKYTKYPRLYFVTNPNGVATEVFSAQYDASSDPLTNTFSIITGSALDQDGAPLSDTDFFAALSVGQLVSGMVYFPITLGGQDGLPSDNIVSYPTGTQFGFQGIRFQNTDTTHVAEYTGGSLVTVGPYTPFYTMPAVGNVGLGVCLKRLSNRFILNRQLAVYNWEPGLLDLSGVANNHAGQLDDAGGTKPHTLLGATCLVPTDLSVTNTVAGNHEFLAQAGLYLEPSFSMSNLPVVGGPWVAGVQQVHAATNPALVDTSTDHGLRVGDRISLGGVVDGGGLDLGINSTFTVLSTPAADQFTVAYDNSAGPDGFGGDVWGAEQSRLVDKGSDQVLMQTILDGTQPFSQTVHIDVRRIRRFHDANAKISANFLPLRYAYETRRGIVTSYTATNKQTGVLGAAGFSFPVDDPDYETGTLYTGTQLGPFNSPDVNVQAGDLFRLIDPTLPPSEQVLERVLVKEVSDEGTLVLEAPGLQTPVVVGLQFEVWLRNAVIPHQQSCDQLLDLVTTKTLLDRVADRTTKKGGYVSVPYGPNRIPDYASAVNKLQDDLMPLGKTFANYGVQVGDIVLIDPQGVVGSGNNLTQRGTRPFGDISIAERGADYTAGKPDLIDDNRGFYRVSKIDTTNNLLVVDGSSAFGSPSAASPATFPKSSLGKTTRGYAVYPTVHDSTNIAPAGEEGQTALRPTSLPGVDNDNAVVAGQPDSYAVNEYSVRPFSYRIIRPTGLLTSEAIDLILSMRERMLSLIEQFKSAMQGNRGGDYYTFQKEKYGRDLGYPTLPDTGTGVFRNILIEDLMGRVDTTPFTNDADCLSVLDRRFWILDQRLDSLTKDGTGYGMKVLPVPAPPGVVAYTSYNTKPNSDVRPVLPDRINIVLDYRDRLRAQRFSWITYRAHRLTGTLANIGRFDSQYATARAQQVSAMQQTRSLT